MGEVEGENSYQKLREMKVGVGGGGRRSILANRTKKESVPGEERGGQSRRWDFFHDPASFSYRVDHNLEKASD